jgi:hypothetical protein
VSTRVRPVGSAAAALAVLAFREEEPEVVPAEVAVEVRAEPAKTEEPVVRRKVAGHVDSKQGPAIFCRLREIETGDKIEVTRGDRTVTFTVTSTAWCPKKAFPTDRAYGPTPDRQLRLITCGGVLDRGLRSYKDNLLVYAVAG